MAAADAAGAGLLDIWLRLPSRRWHQAVFRHSGHIETTDMPDRIENSFVGSAGEETDGIPLRERYGLVLMLILFAYAASGIEGGRLVTATISIVWATVLLATLWSPGLPRTLRRIGLVATLALFLSVMLLGFATSDTAVGLRAIILAIAQLAALLAILNRILRHETVTIQTVMGGIAAYALLAFAMSAVYVAVDKLSDDAFLSGVVKDGDYTYFSFVTLTTVGYGDITAASDLAKRLVVIEAFVGQVFIITFVARLVSLWGKPLTRA